MRVTLVALLLALLLAGTANAFDLINADGQNVDPDGHDHAGLVDPTTLECGTYLSGSALIGAQSDPTGYFFFGTSSGPGVTGRALDHNWVQAAGSTEVVWDMGRAVQSVVVDPSLDHGGNALPGEA